MEAKRREALRHPSVPNPSGKPLRTIHQCLVALGAHPDNIYISGDHRENGVKGLKVRPWHPYKGGHYARSIWEERGSEEIEWMLKQLRRQAIIRYHPDRHEGEKRKAYEVMTQRINEAYQRGLRILKHHNGGARF